MVGTGVATLAGLSGRARVVLVRAGVLLAAERRREGGEAERLCLAVVDRHVAVVGGAEASEIWSEPSPAARSRAKAAAGSSRDEASRMRTSLRIGGKRVFPAQVCHE